MENEVVQETEQKLPAISNEQKKRNLESTLYAFNRKFAFYAAFLSEISIEHTDRVPTAAMSYDKKTNEFKTLINPAYFDSLTPDERVGVLYHEVLHFTHGHLLRMDLMESDPETMTPEEKIKWMSDRDIKNIAADIAINQFIPVLPKGCMQPELFKDDQGQPFPKFKTYEVYYELLQRHGDNGHNKKMRGEYVLVDEHMWEQLSEDEKARMLGKAKEVIKRTVEKTSREHSEGSTAMKGLIDYIDTEINKLNYKQLLKLAIKQTVSKSEREHTWNRPNRRYGVYAPGSRCGKTPLLNVYVDTSGSISHTEINKFLKVIKGFLNVGASTANIILWHDAIYHEGKIKKSTDINDLPVEGGGTQINDVVEHINKNSPNLSLILTDGFFSKAAKIKDGNPVIWIISDDGGKDHPYKGVGTTVLLKGVIG